MTPSTEDLIYMAGYFDGEGSVIVTVGNKLRTCPGLSVKVASGDKETIQLFADSFSGGKVYEVKPGKRASRQMYCWTAGCNKGQAVLKQLLPYLKAKRIPAELALQMCFHISGSGRKAQHLSESELIKRFTIRAAITAFNNRVTIAN